MGTTYNSTNTGAQIDNFNNRITSAELQINNKLGIVNYIVSQGTSGNWHYRKWQDGTAECWGVFPFSNLTSYATWNNMPSYSQTIALPSGLFTTNNIIPSVMAQVGTGHSLTGTIRVSSTSIIVYACTSVPTSASGNFYVYCIGQ